MRLFFAARLGCWRFLVAGSSVTCSYPVFWVGSRFYFRGRLHVPTLGRCAGLADHGIASYRSTKPHQPWPQWAVVNQRHGVHSLLWLLWSFWMVVPRHQLCYGNWNHNSGLLGLCRGRYWPRVGSRRTYRPRPAKRLPVQPELYRRVPPRLLSRNQHLLQVVARVALGKGMTRQKPLPLLPLHAAGAAIA